MILGNRKFDKYTKKKGIQASGSVKQETNESQNEYYLNKVHKKC